MITRKEQLTIAAFEAAHQAELAVLKILQVHAQEADPETITDLDPLIQTAQNAASNIHHRLRDLKDHIQQKQN